jgi:copper homeostasis protein
MNFKLEVIAFNIESCVLAQQSGAHRIELCDNSAEGGTTPSIGMIKAARAKVDIELFPIIRPRGGEFFYTVDEFDIMKEDILQCKNIGCDGVVIGLLHLDGTVDKTRTSQLVNLAYPMSVTFHRAFDRTNDPFKALEDIIDCGCERILTSGQQPTASEGIELINALIRHADDRIIIMPGSGLRSDNISSIAKQSGAVEFHSSARMISDSRMNFNNPTMKELLKTVVLDAAEVSKMATLLSGL